MNVMSVEREDILNCFFVVFHEGAAFKREISPARNIKINAMERYLILE